MSSDETLSASPSSPARVSAGQPLRRAWQSLLAAEPHLRQRDAAARLAVSEAELVASLLGGDGEGYSATLLDGQWDEILAKLTPCGPITALTRNEQAVLEDKGAHFDLRGESTAPPDAARVELRLFLTRWRHGFALDEPQKEGLRHSVQFFDEHGTAVHKVFLGKESNEAAFTSLVAAHGRPELAIDPPAPHVRRPDRPDAEIDVAGLEAAWGELGDTHEFFGLLRRFGAGRLQAMRLAPRWATQVATGAYRTIFELCRDTQLPLMVFVGNRGMIEIHTGVPRKLVVMNSWWNVMDPDWNLHLLETGVASTWVVRKPTRDGVVTSLELFDQDGEVIALLFSKRHEGQTSVPAWSEALEGLARGA